MRVAIAAGSIPTGVAMLLHRAELPRPVWWGVTGAAGFVTLVGVIFIRRERPPPAAIAG